MSGIAGRMLGKDTGEGYWFEKDMFVHLLCLCAYTSLSSCLSYTLKAKAAARITPMLAKSCKHKHTLSGAYFSS